MTQQQHKPVPSAPGHKAGGVASPASGGGEAPAATLARRTEEKLLSRVPPHSAEAEQAVLAGILQRPQLMHSIAEILRPADFYMPAYAAVFRAFCELDAKRSPVDLVSCAEQLKALNLLEEAGGTANLAELAQAVVSGANAEYYASIVRDKAMQRNLIDVCANIIGNSYDASRDVSALLDESEQAVFAVAQRTAAQDSVSSKELLEKVFDNLAKSATNDGITGVTTGYSLLDNYTSGLQPSDLVIVAARPSMGKTAFALCLALNAANRQKIPVGIFSLEMSKEQLMLRMLSAQGRVNLARLHRPNRLTDEDWSNLYQAADVLSNAPIYIDDSPALSTVQLRARARRLKAERRLGLVVIDYLQLMRASRRIDSREQEISEISRSLKGLAKELSIPVVALAQLNRKLEDRKDRRPQLADLRESGAIEQDADVIMFIYRDDVYKIARAQDRPDCGEAEIIIGKQRNGPVGTVNLMYVASNTAFVERAPDHMIPPSEIGM